MQLPHSYLDKDVESGDYTCDSKCVEDQRQWTNHIV